MWEKDKIYPNLDKGKGGEDKGRKQKRFTLSHSQVVVETWEEYVVCVVPTTLDIKGLTLMLWIHNFSRIDLAE